MQNSFNETIEKWTLCHWSIFQKPSLSVSEAESSLAFNERPVRGCSPTAESHIHILTDPVPGRPLYLHMRNARAGARLSCLPFSHKGAPTSNISLARSGRCEILSRTCATLREDNGRRAQLESLVIICADCFVVIAVTGARMYEITYKKNRGRNCPKAHNWKKLDGLEK